MSSAVALAASRVLVVFVVANELGPEAVAPWSIIQAIVSYAIFIGFGTMPALGFELPIARGSGDQDAYDRVLNSGFTYLLVWWMAIAIASVMVVLLSSDFVYIGLGLGAATIYSVVQFQITRLRSELDYSKLIHGNLAGIGALVIGSALMIHAPTFAGLFGVYVCSLIAQGVVTYGGRKISVFQFRANGQEFFRNIKVFHKVGLVLMLTGISYSFLLTSNRWVILSSVGMRELGLFLIASTLIQGGVLLQATGSQVFRPIVLNEWGRSKSWTSIRPTVIRFAQMQLLVSACLLMGLMLFLGPVVRAFFPGFVDGVTPALWAAVGLVFLAPGYPFKLVGQLAGLKTVVAVVQFFSAAVATGLVLIVAYHTKSLESIAMAVCAGFVLDSVFSLCVAIAAWRRIESPA